MALVNPNIAMSYRPTVEYQPRNALAEAAQIQQIMGGQRQAEMADMQMEALRRKDRAISQIQAAAAKNGGPTDRREIARAYVQSGVPEFMQFGLTLEKDLDELDAFARIMGGGARPATGGAAATAPTSAAGALTGAAPAVESAAAPAAAEPAPYTTGPQGVMTYPAGYFGVTSKPGAPAGIRMQDPNAVAAQQAAVDAERERQRGASTPADVMQRAASYANARGEMYPTDNDIAAARRELNIPAPANALAPAAPAPANAMLATQPATPPAGVNQLAAAGGAAAAAAPSADPVAALRIRRDQLIALGTPRALQAAKSLDADIALMSKRITASPGSVVYDASGKAIATAPAAAPQPTVLARLQAEMAALPPNSPLRADYAALIRKETTHAPATTVNVSTEKKYGERFGGLIAEQDAGKLSAAEKAPQLAASANRIIGLVQQGNVFTGPIADVKLNIARALNVAGASNQEKIANTENLIAATGQSTLDAIKNAGLGTGQGFTNKDLEFLRGIAGGTINLTPQTLTELARLQHLTATRSAESWNKRVREIPRDVIQGTGLSTTPITVPPLTEIKKGGAAAPTTPAPAGVDPAVWGAMTPQERSLWQK